jgi:hypothetical protein
VAAQTMTPATQKTSSPLGTSKQRERLKRRGRRTKTRWLRRRRR